MGDRNTTLSFARLVQGSLVHRARLGDVLVADGRRIGDDQFEIAVQWPANHVLLGRSERADSALVAETTRQATAFVAHVMYDVPVGHQFLMTRLRTATMYAAPSSTALQDLTVTVSFEQTARNRLGLSRFVSRVEIAAAGIPFATGCANARIVDRVAYARSRSGAPAWPGLLEGKSVGFAPLQPERVGVLRRELVVVSATATIGTYELLVDTTSPAFFDHPVDHVPGMAIVEGTRQAARDLINDAALDFTQMDVSFHSLVELGRPAKVTISATESSSLDFVVCQDGRTAATGFVVPGSALDE